MAEECKFDMLSLSCSPGFIINVIKIELGESGCYSWQQCCPSANDCTRPASQSHIKFVHSQCNGLNSCRVQAVREYIDCNGNSEFERIKYRCVRKCISKIFIIVNHMSNKLSDFAQTTCLLNAVFDTMCADYQV